MAGASEDPVGPIHDLPPGYLVLPGLVEPHAHLDKALTVDRVGNPDGSLGGAIEAWLGWRTTVGRDDIRQRVRRAALHYLVNGTTTIRTHVDTGPDIGLRAIEAVLEVRAELAPVLDLQVVAAIALPVTGDAGRDARRLGREAIAAGADLVGGAPWLDERPHAAIDAILDVAAWAGTGVDLHLDETTDPRVDTLSHLAARVASGFPGPVTASHVVSLGRRPPVERRAIAERVAAAGVGIVANPITNLYLQGRDDPEPSRGLTAIRELLDAGVAVGAGGDNLQDPFGPVGRADPLETAALLVTAGHLAPVEALAAVTTGAGRVLGLPRDRDDRVAIRATSLHEALGFASPDRIVWRGGSVVARRTVQVTVAGVSLE